MANKDKMIKDLRRLAEVRGSESVSSLLRRTADSLELENDQKYKKLSESISIDLMGNSALTDKGRAVIGNLLVALLDYHSSGTCHGALGPEAVFVFATKVKLVNSTFCYYNTANCKSDYDGLRKILGLFKGKTTNVVPADVKDLIDYLSSHPRDIKPKYVFNAVCSWNSPHKLMVIAYLSNLMRRAMGTYQWPIIRNRISAASLDWTTKAQGDTTLKQSYNNCPFPHNGCLLTFMRITYEHPPENATTLDDITKAFDAVYPTFLCTVVKAMADNGIVEPGDPIDRRCVCVDAFSFT